MVTGISPLMLNARLTGSKTSSFGVSGTEELELEELELLLEEELLELELLGATLELGFDELAELEGAMLLGGRELLELLLEELELLLELEELLDELLEEELLELPALPLFTHFAVNATFALGAWNFIPTS